MFKTSWQTGKLLTKDDSENHLKAKQYLLEQWLNITRFRQEINQDFTNLAKKRLPVIFLEVLTPQRGENFIFSRRLYSKIVRKRLRIPRTSVLVPMNSAVASKVWTEHLVARTCFSVLSCPRTQTSALPVKPCQQRRRSQLTSPAPSALPVNFRQQLRRSRSTFAGNFGAPGELRQQLRCFRITSPATSVLPINIGQQLRRSWSTSPATSALPVNLASNFGAPGELRQQLRCSRITFASNFGAPGQPSPATSAPPVNLRQQLRQDFVICCKCSPKICSFWHPVLSTFRILSSWISRVVCA